MQISGNTILITCGTSGIRRSLAETFQSQGNQVIITGRRQHLLDEITAANPGMEAAILDVEDSDAIASFAEQIKIDHPDLNVVIHNAGIMRSEFLPDGKIDDAQTTVATNLLAPIRLTAVLVKQPQAAIITISSGLAFLPSAMYPTYCATKAAIHSYTQSRSLSA